MPRTSFMGGASWRSATADELAVALVEHQDPVPFGVVHEQLPTGQVASRAREEPEVVARPQVAVVRGVFSWKDWRFWLKCLTTPVDVSA